MPLTKLTIINPSLSLLNEYNSFIDLILLLKV